jgi:hypothetical protein
MHFYYWSLRSPWKHTTRTVCTSSQEQGNTGRVVAETLLAQGKRGRVIGRLPHFVQV